MSVDCLTMMCSCKLSVCIVMREQLKAPGCYGSVSISLAVKPAYRYSLVIVRDAGSPLAPTAIPVDTANARR
jgi:hypothetical protein